MEDRKQECNQEENSPPATQQNQINFDGSSQKLLADVNNYYHNSLVNSDKAKQFLADHKIYSPEAIKHFKLGYCDRSLSNMLPNSRNKAGKEQRNRLVEIGIYRKSMQERFRSAITVPVYDEHGHIFQMYGRKIADRINKKTSVHEYLSNHYTGFWNPSALNSAKLILCSNILDALTFWIHGFKNVTSIYGLLGFNEELLNVLLNSSVKEIYFAFPSSTAGNDATDLISTQLMKEGISCHRLFTPRQISINDFIVTCEHPASELQMLLDGSEFIGGGHFNGEGVSGSKISYTENGDDILFNFSKRKYRIRGLDSNKSYDALRINLHLSYGDYYHTDCFDLLHAKNRSFFVKSADRELNIGENVIKKDIGKILLTLEDIQKERISGIIKREVYRMPEHEKEAALEFLKDKALIKNIVDAFGETGLLTGEKDNALITYLCATSRLLTHPLPLIIQSSSSAGKTTLMSAVLKLMPPEDVEHYTSMTEQSLNYLNHDITHKIIAIAEDAGMKGLEYSIKMLESENGLKVASTGKETKNSKFKTEVYEVKGPVQVSFTTTAQTLDEELANRSVIVSVSENAVQTNLIHDLVRQSETLEGLLQQNNSRQLITVLQNAQRLLDKNILVVNPHAKSLRFPTHKTRLRRDFKKYMTLIKTIAFLHQYQREVKKAKVRGEVISYIEVEISDIELANRLAEKIFSSSLSEISTQTKAVYQIIYQLAEVKAKKDEVEISEVRLSKAEILEQVPCKSSQLNNHLHKLRGIEYIIAHREPFTRLLRYQVNSISNENSITKLGLTGAGELRELV